MKKYLFLLMCMCCLFFAGCASSDDIDEVPSKITEDQLEESQQTWNDIHEYVDQHGLNNIDDVQQHIKNNIDGVKSVTKEGHMLTITTSAGLKMKLNFASYPHYEQVKFNASEMKTLMNAFASTEKLPTANEQALETGKYFADELWSPQSSTASYKKLLPKDNKTIKRANTSTANKVRLSRRNVAVWNPWRDYYGFKYDEGYIKQCVQEVNKNANVWVFNSFSPSSFAALADFDMVVISAHGDEDGNLLIPISIMDSTMRRQYTAEWQADRVALEDGSFEISTGKYGEVSCIVLNKNFYDKYLPKLTNTIIYTVTCFAGKENGEFLTAVKKKDVADYFGSDIQCTPLKIMEEFANYYPKLSRGVTSKKAFAKGKGYINGDVVIRDEETGMDVTHQYTYSQYGNKTVGYYVPFALGIKSTNAKSKHLKSTESGTEIIVKSQIRCGKELSSSLNNIEAGICLKNMTTEEVKYIPFSNSNLVSSSTANYNETSAKSCETKLTDLNLGDDYMYCTYVRNGNETILSDECYSLLGLCPDNNHPHAIDMAEAGVWACCNVGAKSPEEYGGYYAWGETAEKSEYTWDTYKYYSAYNTYYGENKGFTKYCDKESYGYGHGYYKNGDNTVYKEGFTDNLTELVSSDDAATANWGSPWRMPTRTQMEKLRDNCTHEWTQVNDVYGQMFTASNGNRIFLPAAGWRYDTSLYNAGSKGYYWSSSLDTDYPNYAYGLYFYSGYVSVGSYYYRYYGHTVRPVRPKN